MTAVLNGLIVHARYNTPTTGYERQIKDMPAFYTNHGYYASYE